MFMLLRIITSIVIGVIVDAAMYYFTSKQPIAFGVGLIAAVLWFLWFPQIIASFRR